MDMEGRETESGFKSRLVSEICAISTAIIACSHRHSSALFKPSFVDWYRLFGVEEDAEKDLVRKRYRNLALQLHPDKNKHPKAEFAFKLVSEAYTCLKDQKKRIIYDLERKKQFCYECKTIPYKQFINAQKNSDDWEQRKWWKSWKLSKSYRKLQGLKEIVDRLKEESEVIESCLRANAASKKEHPLFNSPHCLFKGQRESPVFNPSDYIFCGYPHLRTQSFRKPENFWCLKTGGKSNYPIFDDKFLIHRKYAINQIKLHKKPKILKVNCANRVELSIARAGCRGLSLFEE